MAFSLLTAKVLMGIFTVALPSFSENKPHSDLSLLRGIFKKENKIPILRECEKYRERQIFPCGQEPDPICASDNKTYENYCQFCMYHWRIDSEVKFVRYGFCKTRHTYFTGNPFFGTLFSPNAIDKEKLLT